MIVPPAPVAVSVYVTVADGFCAGVVPDVVERTPAFIDSVRANSAAAKIGIKSDDLVLFANDELIQSCRALSDLIGRLEPGDTLRLVLRRGNELINVELPVPKKAE